MRSAGAPATSRPRLFFFIQVFTGSGGDHAQGLLQRGVMLRAGDKRRLDHAFRIIVTDQSVTGVIEDSLRCC